MNIKSLFGLAAVGIVLISCQPGSYRIDGFARGVPDGDTVCLALENNPGTPFAHALVGGGKFLFTGETDSASLCRVYLKRQPDCSASLFLEPGEIITAELNLPPALSRVSGSVANNEWQLLNDSIQLFARELRQTLQLQPADSLPQAVRVRKADSLHRRMSQCILHTAQRNQGNALGRYIHQNYKEPRFR